MICSKCNSEIPNGSRFCTVCGADCGSAAPAASEQKNVCTKCGQELNVGAKFCPGCGTPTANAAPLSNGGNSTVSLDKEPNANDLVATMNAAAAGAPAPAVPTPTPASAPAFSGVPTPTPSAAGYNSGASTPNFGAAPSMPQAPGFAPSGSGVMPPMSGAFNGMNGAAAVTVPAKKKVSAGKIVLIIAIVLAVLLGGAAVFFFTNKAAAMSLVMGKPKYAAMIEKDSLKKATKKLDTDVLSNQIKSISSVMSVLATTGADIPYDMPYDWFSLSNTNTSPEIESLVALPETAYQGVDVKSLIKGYNEFLQSTYGANSISGSVSAKIKIGKELADYTDDEIEEILGIINGTEITYDLASTEKFMGTEFGMKLDGKLLNIRIIIEDDGSVYLVFPFATDKVLKYKIDTIENMSSATVDTSVVLDLDSDEIARLIDEIVDIYSGYIKNSSVTMEKGSMNIAGISVEGKEIKADINGKNLENLFKEVFEHIANDKYFSGKVVEYIKNFDDSFTESDYNNAITDLVKDMTGITEDDKLIVTMIVNNSGKVLAKSYTIAASGQQLGTIAFTESDTASAIDFKVFNQSVASLTNVKTNDKDGTITVRVGFGTLGSIGVILDYKGVDEADFGKSKVPVGTYTLSFDTTKLGSMGIDEEIVKILEGFALTASSNVSGKTMTNSVVFSVRDYIDLDLSADITLSDDVSKFSVPSDVIDLTPIINGEDLNDATMETLMNYFEELSNGLSETIKGTVLEDVLSDLVYGITPPSYEDPVAPSRPDDGTPDDHYDELVVLYQKIEDEVNEFFDLLEGYEWYEMVIEDEEMLNDFENSVAYEIAEKYADGLFDLDYEVLDIIDFDNGVCTKAQLDAFNERFSTILKQKNSVIAALDCYYPSQLTGMGPVA